MGEGGGGGGGEGSTNNKTDETLLQNSDNSDPVPQAVQH